VDGSSYPATSGISGNNNPPLQEGPGPEPPPGLKKPEPLHQIREDDRAVQHNFRFIGSPVDGVQFEEDKLVIVEFKTGDSRLTTKQRKIRDLVKKGKVCFEEITIRE
jgi:hypothetical protein